MKPVLKYAYVFLFVISANYVFAQNGSAPAVNSTLNRQSMDSQMERQTPFAMWSSWSNANDKKSANNPEYTFFGNHA